MSFHSLLIEMASDDTWAINLYNFNLTQGSPMSRFMEKLSSTKPIPHARKVGDLKDITYYFPNGMAFLFFFYCLKIFFYACSWKFNSNTFRSNSIFIMFWLSFSDQWICFLYPVWEVFSHYFFKYFPSFISMELQFSYVTPLATVSQVLRLFIFLWTLFSLFFKLPNSININEWIFHSV